MSNVYVWSDLHLGHKNIECLRRHNNKPTEEQHELCYEALAVLNKRDVVWLLGDVVFSTEWELKLREIKADLRIVGGNHDINLKQTHCFSETRGLKAVKRGWLSHAPIHLQELRGRINIHGHTHYQCMYAPYDCTTLDPRYRNVCVEYTPHPIPLNYALSTEYLQECNRLHTKYCMAGYPGSDYNPQRAMRGTL